MKLSFDEGGRLKERDLNIGNDPGNSIRTTYTYRADGALEAVFFKDINTQANNKRYQYVYDLDGKVLKIRENEEDEQEKVFIYDTDGRSAIFNILYISNISIIKMV